MITAIDTNILLDLLLADEHFVEASSRSLEQAAAVGALVVCDVVYAELCAHFSTQRACEKFLVEAGIRVEGLTREACYLASRTWRAYRQQGGRRNRILPDFLIGAHAKIQASRLLTRDRGFYRRMFPSLVLVEPIV